MSALDASHILLHMWHGQDHRICILRFFMFAFFFCFQFVFSNCIASSFRGGQVRSELSIRTSKMRYILGLCPGMTSRRLCILLGFVTDEAAEVVYTETGSRKWVVKGLG